MRTRTPAFALLIALFTSGIAFAASSSDAPPQQADVVFVCEHGNVKSLMAASYFNALARERNSPHRAIARGSAPDSDTVPAVIAQGLKRDRIDVADFHPAAVGTKDLSGAAHVVLISTELPSSVPAPAAGLEHWNDVPPATTDFDAARSALQAHVHALLDQVSSAQAGPADAAQR